MRLCHCLDQKDSKRMEKKIIPSRPYLQQGLEGRRSANCQLCPCTECKPLSLSPSQVKNICHLGRPGNHTTMLCSTHSLTYPLQAATLKTLPRGNVRGTQIGKHSWDNEMQKAPWSLGLQLELCSKSGFPVSIRQSSGLKHWSPTFLAPGTGFMEDNFSLDWVGAGGEGQKVELRR